MQDTTLDGIEGTDPLWKAVEIGSRRHSRACDAVQLVDALVATMTLKGRILVERLRRAAQGEAQVLRALLRSSLEYPSGTPGSIAYSNQYRLDATTKYRDTT